MFLGHVAVALAAKPLAPRVSLGVLIVAAQALDLLWPALLMAGVERVRITPQGPLPLDFEHYPWSHSLAMVLVWALLAAVAARALGAPRRATAVIAALVASHWFLDALVHRPDLPLAPDLGARVGLGLWLHPTATLLLESALFAAGLLLYVRTTRPRDGVGRWAFVALVLLLLLIFAGDRAGGEPPSVAAIAWTGHAQWLLVALAAWADAHRGPRMAAVAAGAPAPAAGTPPL